MRDLLRRHHFLAVFTPLSSTMGFGLGMSQVATSLTALHLGASPVQIALIAAAQNVGVLLSSIQAGILIDQLGPIRPYLLGSGSIALLYLATPLSSSPWWLLGCTFLISLLMPFRFVTMTATFLANLHAVGEAKAGWQRGSHMIGMFLLGPIAGAWAFSSFGVRATWWIVGSLAILTTLTGPVLFASHPPRRGAGPRLTLSGIRSQLGLLWHEPTLRRCSVVDFLIMSVSAFFSFFMVVIAVNNLGISPLEATHFVNAKGFTLIVALFFLGTFASRLGPQASVKTSLAILAVSLLILASGSDLATLMPASLLLGLGLGLAQITNLTQQARIGSRVGLGRVAGVIPMVATTGSLLGNLGGGLLGGVIGLQNVYYVLGAIVAGSLVWIHLEGTVTEPSQPSDSNTSPVHPGATSTLDPLGFD